MDTARLTVVSFARPQSGAALLDALSDLGYQARLMPHDGPSLGHLPGSTGAVVFLLGAGARPREHVLRAATCLRRLPSLAMVVKGECDWDQELIDACCDCAQWPCAGDELAFRLGRLCQCLGGAVSPELDSMLTETLAGLNLIGRSPAFLDAMTRLRRLLPCDAPVLILGETGTGKELVARAIHYLGPRANGPFVPVNCGALPDHLVENELFGHERGAYTDAKVGTQGAIGQAAGGTLFLDEVEALSAKAQAALLRFLQDGEYRPLGAQRARRSQVRVVAATNVDLRTLGEQRAFRLDLLFRLDILSVTLPPLRARRDDIALLAEHFLARYSGQYGLPAATLDRRSLSVLQEYGWPGNVRELENLAHRQVLLAGGGRVMLSPGVGGAEPMISPPEVTPSGSSFAEAKALAIESFEREYLTRLMGETKGNVSQAARRANKERRALGKLLKKHGINADIPR